MKFFFYELNPSNYKVEDIVDLKAGLTLYLNQDDCVHAMKVAHRQRTYTHEFLPRLGNSAPKGIVITVSLIGEEQDAIKVDKSVTLKQAVIAKIEGVSTHTLSLGRLQTSIMFAEGAFRSLVNAPSSLGTLEELPITEDEADAGWGLGPKLPSLN